MKNVSLAAVIVGCLFLVGCSSHPELYCTSIHASDKGVHVIEHECSMDHHHMINHPEY